jgi:hypothetical protein
MLIQSQRIICGDTALKQLPFSSNFSTTSIDGALTASDNQRQKMPLAGDTVATRQKAEIA